MAMQKTLFRNICASARSIVLVSFLLLGGDDADLYFPVLAERQTGAAVSKRGESGGVDSEQCLAFGQSILCGVLAHPGVHRGLFLQHRRGYLCDRPVGKTVVCSDLTSDCVHQNHTIPTEILSRALEGEYSGTGTLGGIYGNSQYIFGVPIRVENEDGIVVIGTVFTASDMSSLAGFRSDVIQMFLIASLAAFVISFLAVGLLSYNMVRPLREMAVAARCFGEGTSPAVCRSTHRMKSASWRWPSTTWRLPFPLPRDAQKFYCQCVA